MRTLVLCLAAALPAALLPLSALAQQEPLRGNTPPGVSQDGSRPAEGAIKGGSILPGERGGLPEEAPAASREERLQRCRELSGSLREECLRRERNAAGGASTRPDLQTPTLPDTPRRDPGTLRDPETQPGSGTPRDPGT